MTSAAPQSTEETFVSTQGLVPLRHFFGVRKTRVDSEPEEIAYEVTCKIEDDDGHIKWFIVWVNEATYSMLHDLQVEILRRFNHEADALE
ncbi:MAG: hypothetical protein V4611_00365 [Patescibacteria group bacterium]